MVVIRLRAITVESTDNWIDVITEEWWIHFCAVNKIAITIFDFGVTQPPELLEWGGRTVPDDVGGAIEFEDEKQATLFLLRWS